MNSICSSPVWDSNLTWYTDNPDFTKCFQYTVLSLVPIGLFLVFIPFDIWHILSTNNGTISWNMKNISKIGITLSLLINELLTIYASFYSFEENISDIDMSEIISSAIHAAVFILILWLMIMNRSKGIQSSGNIFIFWFLSTMAEIIRFRSSILTLLYELEKNNLKNIIVTTIKLFLLSAMVLLSFLNDGGIDNEKYISLDKIDAEDKCSYPAKMTFWWILPLIRLGARKTLTKDDVQSLDESKSTKYLCETLETYMNKNGKNDLYKGIIKLFGCKYLVVCIVFFLQSILVFGNPLLMIYLMEHVKSDESSWKGVFYAVSLLVINLIKVFFNERCIYKMFLYAMLMKGALCAIIYKKSLRLSPKASKLWTSGEIVNLVSVDVQRIQEAWQFSFPLVSGIADLFVSCYFLISFLGLSSLAGMAVLIILIPCNVWLSSLINKIQVKFMKEKDERIKMTTEVLNGIKVLKLYAWEQPFEDLILKLRSTEVNSLRKSFIFESTLIVFFIISPFFVSFFTFVVYVFGYGYLLTPNTAFVSLALFNILRIPMGDVPFVVGQLIKCGASFSRISKFMKSEEIVQKIEKDNFKKNSAITVKNGSFAWQQDDYLNLKDIDIDVKIGSLVAVIGQVGSGKSSIISSILGETYLKEGSVNINGSIAYVPQQSWIQNATIKGNILFNSQYRSKWYKKVSESCELNEDFKSLIAGDQTEIGEKGINISGGQKQRISIARAVYSKKDIYLFDDPLSAVDSHVAKKLFDNVIGPNGLLKNKTRILVTHGLKFLSECDYIYFVNGGQLLEKGTYDELKKNSKLFSDLIIQYNSSSESDNKYDDDDLIFDKSSYHSEFSASSKRLRKHSIQNVEHQSENDEQTQNRLGKLIETEEMEEGRINSKVYFHYFKNIGIMGTLAMVFGFSLFIASDLSANEWLSSWSSDSYKGIDYSNHLVGYRVGIYGLFGIFQGIFFGLGLIAFTFGAIKSSKRTHDMMLFRVMRAPMSLFDTTPTGRLLNRFSRDVNTMDTTLVMETQKLFLSILKIIGGIVIICFNMPPFVIVSLIMIIIYLTAIVLSMRSLRQLMRLESVSRSPIYSYVQESNIGATSIRAYGSTDIFINNMYNKIDENQKFYFSYVAINSWLAIILQILGAFFVFFTALIAVLLKGYIGPASVGLTINYAIIVTLTLYVVVRNAAVVETNVISIERILEYTKLPQEAERNIGDKRISLKWPQYGEIKFNSYQTRYRTGLDLVLNGLDFTIKPGEKIGIVGRTGAGKSSLSLALFRIIEATGGSISIDGVNIADIGLHNLRKKLSIIPQDPVLFYGSLRMNIDPFNDYGDDEVWSALEQSHLKNFASSLPTGLNHLIAEGGQNLSIGQRQLICLARALLRHSKILILDEATAAIDMETDEIIQQTIKKEFKHSTILTIAHRLNTIMDSDRVMVLSNGNIQESGSPRDLLLNDQSAFYKMATDAGIL